MMTIIIAAAVGVVGFVAGVLVGRNNKARVEKYVGDAEKFKDKVF